eukprot:bmy_21705T0
MAFNAANKVNLATWNQAQLECDLSNKIYQESEMSQSGASSKFNRKLREEAQRKKYSIVLKEFGPRTSLAAPHQQQIRPDVQGHKEGRCDREHILLHLYAVP